MIKAVHKPTGKTLLTSSANFPESSVWRAAPILGGLPGGEPKGKTSATSIILVQREKIVTNRKKFDQKMLRNHVHIGCLG